MQVGDLEQHDSQTQGASLLQPQKSDSASSLRGAYTKDNWEGSDHSPASSLPSDQQSAYHSTLELQPGPHSDQSEPLHQAELHETQQEDKVGQHHQHMGGEGQMQQAQQQVQASVPSQLSRDELSDSDDLDSSDQPLLQQQEGHKQSDEGLEPGQQQQHVQSAAAQSQQVTGLDKEASAVSFMTTDGEWSFKQLVLFSLYPSRLWAFLGLGIPGGLASSVQSAAYEVTTAMAGVLGE